jgi:predicted nucleotidyltransferase
MGMPRRRATAPSLLDALFTPVQQRVLALLFGQPDRRFQTAEIIRLAKSGTGAVHRQLQKLARAGLVAVTRSGNQKHYQADKSTPVFEELHSLIVKTVGVVEPLRRALMPLAGRLRAAFVFGSVAKGGDTASSDLDLLVVSDSVEYPEVFEALQPVERALARPIRPTVLTVTEWRRQTATPDSFAARVAHDRRLFVLGTDDDID